MRPPAIAVWGHFHGRNLGDDLVVSVLLDAARRRRPNARILTISLSPEDARRRHGVDALPINPHELPGDDRLAHADVPRSRLRRTAHRIPGAPSAFRYVQALSAIAAELRFLPKAWRQLRGVDLLVVAGSGQLLDAFGIWQHPYTVFRWAVLARLRGTATAFPSVGAGPLRRASSRWMVRTAVKWSQFVSVRDEHSRTVLTEIGVTRPLPVAPDMAWAYEPRAAAVGTRDGGPPVVGLNAMPHWDPRFWGDGGDAAGYAAYVTKLTDVVASLLDENYRVAIFSSQLIADRLVADDLRAALAARGITDQAGLSWRFDGVTDVDDLLEVLSECTYVVASRFHVVLLALFLGIPTVGLAYHAKTRELLERVGRPDDVLDIESFEPDDVLRLLRHLREEDGEAGRAELRATAARLGAEVEAQFDAFLPRP